MNQDIALMREVIVKVTQLLAGKGLVVTQRGASAYVENDKAGKPIRVNIPQIPDTATAELLMAIQGFIDHEVAHILFTEFTYKMKERRASAKLHGLWNMLEDPLIEKRMADKFPGSHYKLGRLHEFFLKKITEPHIAEAKGDPKKEFEAIIVVMARALCGQKVFNDWMTGKGYWEHPLVKSLLDGLPKDIRARMTGMKNTRDAFAIAEVYHSVLCPPPPPAPPAPPPGSPTEPSKSDSTEKTKSDGKGANKDKPEDEEDEGAGGEKSAEKDKSASTGDDEKPSEDKGESSEEDAGEEADGPKETEKPGEGEKGEDESEDEETSGSSESESDDSELPSEGAGDADGSDGDGDGAVDPEESEDDADGDDGERDNDHGEPADRERDEDGDDGEVGTSASDGGEDEESDDGSAGAGSESDDSDAGDEGSGGEAGEGSAGGEPSDELEESGESKDPGMGSSAFSDMEIEVDGDKFKDAIVGEITDLATRMTRGAEYRVFTKDYDDVSVITGKVTDEEFESFDSSTRHMIGPMQKDIERLMASRSNVLKLPGFRSGRLHAASLHKLLVGDDRVFRRLHENTSKDTAVGLVVDNSGSMGGKKMTTAMQAAYALSQTLERVKIAHEVLGFTTLPANRTLDDLITAEEARIGKQYGRIEPIYMPIYKDFNERLTPAVKQRFAVAAEHQNFLRNNVDGECIEVAATRLMRRKEKRKVLIVLSDGSPSAAAHYTYRSGERPEAALNSHLHQVIEESTKRGIEVIGIGIMDDSVRHYYPKHVVLKRIEELPSTIMKELKRILLAA